MTLTSFFLANLPLYFYSTPATLDSSDFCLPQSLCLDISCPGHSSPGILMTSSLTFYSLFKCHLLNKTFAVFPQRHPLPTLSSLSDLFLYTILWLSDKLYNLLILSLLPLEHERHPGSNFRWFWLVYQGAAPVPDTSLIDNSSIELK